MPVRNERPHGFDHGSNILVRQCRKNGLKGVSFILKRLRQRPGSLRIMRHIKQPALSAYLTPRHPPGVTHLDKTGIDEATRQVEMRWQTFQHGQHTGRILQLKCPGQRGKRQLFKARHAFKCPP